MAAEPSYHAREERRRSFMTAAAEGDVAALSKHIQNGFDVDTPDWEGETGAILAAWHDRPAALRLLIAAGADLEARENQGGTALLWAVRRNSLAAAEELVAAFANLQNADYGGRTPLETAKDLGLAEMTALLEDAIATEPARKAVAGLALQHPLTLKKPLRTGRHRP